MLYSIILQEVINFMTRRILFFSFALVLLSAVHSSAFDEQIKWSADIDAPLTSGITVHGNILILGDKSGTLHALSTDTGAEIWTYTGSSMILGTPAIISNEVIFAHEGGEISCVDISDGSLIWQSLPVSDSGGSFNDGISCGGGLVFAAKTDGEIFAIDAFTCEDVWTYQARQGLRTAPAYGGGFVFQGEYDGLFSIIDAKTGERINGGGAGGAVNTPAVRDGKVYFSAADGSVQSVQIQDVIPLWSINVKDPVTTSPALGGNIIAVGTARGYVFALNEPDGKTLWQYDTKGGSITALPVVADGLVFAGGGDGVMHMLDAGTGKELHRFTTKQGIETNPAYSDGVLYFGGNRGIIYALQ